MTTQRWACAGNVEAALAWLDELTSDALAGDVDSAGPLPEAVDHFLSSIRRQGIAA